MSDEIVPQNAAPDIARAVRDADNSSINTGGHKNVRTHAKVDGEVSDGVPISTCSQHDGVTRKLTISAIVAPENEPETLGPSNHDGAYPSLTFNQILLRLRAIFHESLSSLAILKLWLWNYTC